MAGDFVHCGRADVIRRMRKPGEPIYLRVHLIALTVVLLATVALPRAAEFVFGPLSFGTRALAGIAIAVAGGIGLYLLYNTSARNEP